MHILSNYYLFYNETQLDNLFKLEWTYFFQTMKTYNILILEDVPFDVELMEREIKKSGIEYSSRTVEIEEDFIKEINEFKPDLILADHSLPHFDGLSALEIAKLKCPEVPFIFVSGTIGEIGRASCRERV